MLHITETTEYYGPSKELKEKFNNLCMYAAAAKMLGQVKLYEQIKEQYDSLSRQYNDLAKKMNVDSLVRYGITSHIETDMSINRVG